jgi:hypothetical protein
MEFSNNIAWGVPESETMGTYVILFTTQSQQHKEAKVFQICLTLPPCGEEVAYSALSDFPQLPARLVLRTIDSQPEGP